MDYLVDLDRTHGVIRLTVTAENVTPELAEEICMCLSRIASSGGPFASILDASRVTSWMEPAVALREVALQDPAVPGGRTHVAVAREPGVFGLFRMFEQWRDFFRYQYQVVHSLEEAYEIVGVRPEDFTERLLPERLAA